MASPLRTSHPSGSQMRGISPQVNSMVGQNFNEDGGSSVELIKESNQNATPVKLSVLLQPGDSFVNISQVDLKND